MKILGIDPGTAIVGWGIIEINAGKVKPIAWGSIQPETKSITGRLITIYHEIGKIINIYKPDSSSVEDLFFATNAKTAISVGQARGTILLTLALNNLTVNSYTPLVVKQTICGDGKADKIQVGKMILLTLGLKQLPKPDDVTDALAIALTHAYNYKMKLQTV